MGLIAQIWRTRMGIISQATRATAFIGNVTVVNLAEFARFNVRWLPTVECHVVWNALSTLLMRFKCKDALFRCRIASSKVSSHRTNCILAADIVNRTYPLFIVVVVIRESERQAMRF